MTWIMVEKTPLEKLVQTCQDALKAQHMVDHFTDKRNSALNSAQQLWFPLKGCNIKIKLTKDGRDKPEIGIYMHYYDGEPQEVIILEKGNVLRGKLVNGPDTTDFGFLIDDCRGPASKMGKYDGWHCKIYPRFIASINGVSFKPK